ncbi:hypothetical protein JIN86_04815 [Lysinibacillus sp. HST-98]|uniref:hypothetical protein n=1 Tax=Lysinibacillus sp. HST-98 TaxID=2800419 RepID=UPI001927C6DA|nr:hypothetical protein [Lysinibacillus sp. HST-98]MBL3728931.1 hypothetical protein [Lysinibacillus sp. HST-98]
MYSLGIRVSPSKTQSRVYFSVIEIKEDHFEICRCNYLNIPNAIEIPEQLAFIRTNLLAVISQYGITVAGLRITENIARNPSVFRMNIEGVIQELFANSTIEKYAILQISQMKSLLDDSSIKSYLDAEMKFAEIEEWETLKLEERECIVTACAVSNL